MLNFREIIIAEVTSAFFIFAGLVVGRIATVVLTKRSELSSYFNNNLW